MFRIDKASVDYKGQNMPIIIVRDQVTKSKEEAKAPGSAAKLEDKSEAAISKAKSQGELIIKEAKKQAEEIRKKAWEQGFAEGREKGKKKYLELKEQETAFLDTVFQRIEAVRNEIAKELEGAVLRLSLDIAEKILNKELEKDDTSFVGMVKAAVEGISEEQKVVLRVSAEDYDRFFREETHWQEFCDESIIEDISIICDEYMGLGECVIEYDNGILDAGIDSQLKMISRALNQG